MRNFLFVSPFIYLYTILQVRTTAFVHFKLQYLILIIIIILIIDNNVCVCTIISGLSSSISTSTSTLRRKILKAKGSILS